MRLMVLAIPLYVGLFIIAIRLILLQCLQGSELVGDSFKQQHSLQTMESRPGEIRDRNGRLLATSMKMKSLYVVPNRIDDLSQFCDRLSGILHRDSQDIESRIERYRDKAFLWVQRRIDPKLAEVIDAAQFPIGTYGFREEYKRVYPFGSVATHLLGTRDIDNHGHGGVEQAYDQHIRGESTQLQITRDARGRVIHAHYDAGKPIQNGQLLTLTIDLRIQMLVEDQLSSLVEQWEPYGACVIVMDPCDSEVLAMASYPLPHQEHAGNSSGWINRAISWSYEPGSTFKPLVMAYALEQQLVSQQDEFDGHGGIYRMGPRLLRDSHPHGTMSLSEVMSQSSNIGMAQIGERLTNTGLYEAVTNFGFGRNTGIRLPGEISGRVRSLSQWNGYSTGSIPMGQELSVTPLQLISAHAVLARGGDYRPPKIIQWSDREEQESHSMHLIQQQVLSPPTAHWMIQEAMRKVMTEGTARRIDQYGLPMFGKTGTSQIYDAELGRYSHEKTVCSFICGAPAREPELLVLVVVDQPQLGTSHYGGTVAAPSAATILHRSLTIHREQVASVFSELNSR